MPEVDPKFADEVGEALHEQALAAARLIPVSEGQARGLLMGVLGCVETIRAVLANLDDPDRVYQVAAAFHNANDSLMGQLADSLRAQRERGGLDVEDMPEKLRKAHDDLEQQNEVAARLAKHFEEHPEIGGAGVHRGYMMGVMSMCAALGAVAHQAYSMDAVGEALEHIAASNATLLFGIELDHGFGS